VSQGETWVRLVITGQSFMLHQIRKMVGLAVAVMRGVAPPDAIPLALEPRRDVNTPIAPDVGLFLDEGIFEAYNSRWGDSRDDRVSLEPYSAAVGRFKVVPASAVLLCIIFRTMLQICIIHYD